MRRYSWRTGTLWASAHSSADLIYGDFGATESLCMWIFCQGQAKNISQILLFADRFEYTLTNTANAALLNPAQYSCFSGDSGIFYQKNMQKKINLCQPCFQKQLNCLDELAQVDFSSWSAESRVTGEDRQGRTVWGRYFTWKTSAFMAGEVLNYNYGSTALLNLNACH